MNIEKMREDFEASFRNRTVAANANEFADVMLERGSDGKYRSIWVSGAWWAWQASRAALVIELPEPYAVIGDYAACGGSRSVWDNDYAEKIDDRMCKKTPVYDKASLEAAGVKVKP